MSVLLALGAGHAHADDGDVISAERPGFSSSPVALKPSVMQIEAGYEYVRAGNSIDAHALPLTLFRYGIADEFELQLGWAGYAWVNGSGQDINGIRDASIGMKWQVSDEDAALPLALFAGVSLPIGDDDFTSDEVDPTIGAFWSFDAGLSWFGTVLVSDVAGSRTVGNAVGISLPIDDRSGGYVEYFGIFAEGNGPEHYVNGGIAYLPRNNVQVDLHLGAGVNDRAADLFVGAGIAYRF
ncbi:MAG: transporter [Woeseiaceae bacterium]|nr:transporter [Woeseiaceae bacterium]